MLSLAQSFLIVASSVAASLLMLFLLRHFWAPKTRSEHNATLGGGISFLGTTYAVILAFMLSGVWSNYLSAEANVEVEANALVNMFRVTEGLPSPQSTQIRKLALQYAEFVVNDEWPAMDRGSTAVQNAPIILKLWQTVMQTEPVNHLQQASLDRALAELTNMTEHRRIRLLQSRSSLPAMFWVVLIAGGIMNVAFACLLGIEQKTMQMIQVSSVATMISLLLVTIADIDQPFRGAIHIEPVEFKLALAALAGQML